MDDGPHRLLSPFSTFRRRTRLKGIIHFTTMQLKREAIQEFKAIYERKHGRKLTDEEAEEMATCLLRVVSILYRPRPSDGRAVRFEPPPA